MKKYKFLDRTEILVDNDTCRGCYLETSNNLPQEILSIWSNDFFVIRQDAEIPMPGFYIVSTRQHINTMADLPIDKAEELGAIINRLRFHMNNALGISRLHMILEERMIEPHLHIWMLPLWPDIMNKHNIEPKVWNSNIYEYLTYFKYEENRDVILKYNDVMRDVLSNDAVLKKLIKWKK